VRCEHRELFGFGLQAMLVTALVSAFGRGHGAPRERLYGPALGDRAMWIVMYVAMIASLSAMGMLPVAEYRDQLPHADA
jgi:hypothetical protein